MLRRERAQCSHKPDYKMCDVGVDKLHQVLWSHSPHSSDENNFYLIYDVRTG